MFSQPFWTRKAGCSSIINELCSEIIWIFHDAMPIIVDAPLTLTFELTLETYYRPLGALQWYIKSIQFFLAASIPFLCIIIRIQNLRDISVSEPPLYTSFA